MVNGANVWGAGLGIVVTLGLGFVIMKTLLTFSKPRTLPINRTLDRVPTTHTDAEYPEDILRVLHNRSYRCVVVQYKDITKLVAFVSAVPAAFGVGDTVEEAIQDLRHSIEAIAKMIVSEGREKVIKFFSVPKPEDESSDEECALETDVASQVSMVPISRTEATVTIFPQAR